MIKIANPLYDSVFKHLMAEPKLACKVLSTILGKEVIAVQPMPQEMVEPLEKGRFSIRRLDYRATILDESGRKEEVHIEVQKSQLPTNMVRFRSYLGRLYAGQQPAKVMEPTYSVEEPAATYGYLPIIVIYLLGYGVRDIPYQAVRANHRLVDLNTGQELEGIGADFVDKLTHTTYIIQANRQPEVPRTPLERLLMLFNQDYQVPGYGCLLELPYKPEGFEDVVDYLFQTALSPQEREAMERECWLEMGMMAMEGVAERQAERIERLEEVIRQEREEALRAQEIARQREAELRRDKALAIKREEEARREKEDALRREEEARRREEEARLTARRAQIEFARTMLEQGMSVEKVALITGLSEDEVRALQSK